MSKYLVYIKERGGPEDVLLFEDIQGHDDIFNLLRKTHKTVIVVSAGFWHIDHNGKFVCSGRSVSLNTESRYEDSMLLNIRFLGHI